jgi:signal transduction histidine kinase
MAASIKPERLAGVAAPRKTARSGELHIVRDDVAGLVAHDLRTPLAAISMNLDFALGELPPGASDAVRAALEDCRGANARAVRIVSDMADAVHLSSGERRATVGEADVGAIVAAVIEGVAAEAKARDVVVSASADASSCQADVYLLTRALERVVERAVWQGRGGGRVHVEVTDAVIRVAVSPAPHGGPDSARSLGTHFAEAAMRAQGGGLVIESDGETLVFRIALPP